MLLAVIFAVVWYYFSFRWSFKLALPMVSLLHVEAHHAGWPSAVRHHAGALSAVREQANEYRSGCAYRSPCGSGGGDGRRPRGGAERVNAAGAVGLRMLADCG